MVEEVRSAEVAATEIGMPVTVKRVGARLRDDVQNDVSGLAVFRVVIVREHLELFDFFHGGSERVSCGRRCVGNIAAIDADRYAPVSYAPVALDIGVQARIVVSDAWRRGRETLIVIGYTADRGKRGSRRQVRHRLVVDYR